MDYKSIANTAKNNLLNFNNKKIREWVKYSRYNMYSTLHNAMDAKEAFVVYPNAYTILDDVTVTTPYCTSDLTTLKNNYLRAYRYIYNYSVLKIRDSSRASNYVHTVVNNGNMIREY